MLKQLLNQERERLLIKNLTTGRYKFIKKSDYTEQELDKIKRFYNAVRDHLICEFDETKTPDDYNKKYQI